MFFEYNPKLLNENDNNKIHFRHFSDLSKLDVIRKIKPKQSSKNRKFNGILDNLNLAY